MILKKLELGNFASNCYIVGDETTKEGMIIDPGAEADAILSALKPLGLTIKYIVLTHAHIDHIGAVNEVKKATNAKLALHSKEAPNLNNSPFRMMVPDVKDSPPPDVLLNEGDQLQIGKLTFNVVHTPGHTPGGICIIGDGIVFTGDTLFNFSIGRTDLPGGSTKQEMDSIYQKLMVLPDKTRVCPGHGPDSTIGAERRVNPFILEYRE